MKNQIKRWVLLVLLSAFFLPAFSQYYYKDIVVTAQSMNNRKAFKDAKVREVSLTSTEGNGQTTEGFQCEQKINSDFTLISSFTRSNFSITTNLLASYNLQGQLIKTLDTSESYQSTTLYSYDGAGRIISIINSSLETDNQVRDSETHIWQYNDKGLPISMIKIKGETDSTFVMLKADENGNIIEEHPVRRGQPLPAVYYYYNSSKQLTDIVQYNEKAQRLLPIYIFEYDGSGNISSMVFVPSGSNDYQRWYYTYNDKGLRTKDACFDKKRQLMGSIEYNYSFGK